MSGGNRKKGVDSITDAPDPSSGLKSSEFVIILNKLTEMAEKLGALQHNKKQSDETLKNYNFLSSKYDDQQKQMQASLSENKQMYMRCLML